HDLGGHREHRAELELAPRVAVPTRRCAVGQPAAEPASRDRADRDRTDQQHDVDHEQRGESDQQGDRGATHHPLPPTTGPRYTSRRAPRIAATTTSCTAPMIIATHDASE